MDPVADIHALEPAHHPSFNREGEQPGPGAFIRSARDNGVKLFADSRFKEERRRGFADLPFDLVSGILFGGEMFGQHIQFSKAIRRSSAGNGGLQ